MGWVGWVWWVGGRTERVARHFSRFMRRLRSFCVQRHCCATAWMARQEAEEEEAWPIVVLCALWMSWVGGWV